MPANLSSTIAVQQQLAMALNRLGQDRQAEAILKQIIEDVGNDAETCGILGRIYKDRWENACQANDHDRAIMTLQQAIITYLEGCAAEPTEVYPAINAATLMIVTDVDDESCREMHTNIRFLVDAHIRRGNPDYFDYATLAEVNVLDGNRIAAEQAVDKALAAVREQWEPITTARNLRLIQEARQRQGSDTSWITALAHRLMPSVASAP
jgi:tetratricopeptide (TPR) repeat protein